jgi:predicted nucleic acid-binding Zn finger protein
MVYTSMQTLQLHKKSKPTSKTTNQKVVEKKQELEYENKREGHGRNIALTRSVYRLQNTDTFYVESENSNNTYYFVRYNPSVFEWCSCLDNSTRGGIKCKHTWGIEYAIRKNTLKEIEHLPKNAKISSSCN